MRIRQGGSNANAALSLDSDTGDQSYYRYMRFYRKGQTSSIAKLDIDFSANTTDNLIDKTDFSKLDYNQDFQLSLDNNLRLKTDTFIIPDGIEKDNSEQAF
jgi:hypothetical protein